MAKLEAHVWRLSLLMSTPVSVKVLSLKLFRGQLNVIYTRYFLMKSIFKIIAPFCKLGPTCNQFNIYYNPHRGTGTAERLAGKPKRR